MKKSIALLGTLLAMASTHADTLPAGILITGSVNGGVATRLLGLDHSFADEIGSNITALAPTDLEFMTDEYSVAVDLFTDGTLQFWNNSGAASLPGSYTFTFSFAGAAPLTGITLSDTTSITGGTIAATLVNASTVAVTFSNLTFSSEFTTFSATAVSAVPEPASYALLAAGLGLLAVRRARSAKP